jgi:hypothetical protein
MRQRRGDDLFERVFRNLPPASESGRPGNANGSFIRERSRIAILEAFPDCCDWGNLDMFDQGYDMVVLGSAGPIRIDPDAVQRKFDRAPAMAQSLRDAGFNSAAELLGTCAFRNSGPRQLPALRKFFTDWRTSPF